MLVVGAGLAGLTAALALTAAGRRVTVLEASDAPGGRMRSDRVDGFTIDRGFQVLNSAYSELRRLGGLAGIPLGEFERGAVVPDGDARPLVADPRQVPVGALGFALAPLGPASVRLRLAAHLARCGFAPLASLLDAPDRPYRDELARLGIAGEAVERLVAPFLSGVLLEDELATSSRFVAYVWRTFVRGRVLLPQAGVGALPAALAARLPVGAIEYGRRVAAVRPGEVDVDDEGTRRADAVVVAADPVTGARLAGLEAPRMRSVTTVWHAAETAPTSRPAIVLGDRRPILNSVPISVAVAGYAPPGRALVATSWLGAADGTGVVVPGGAVASVRDARGDLSRLWRTDASRWEEVAVSSIPEALPALPAGSSLVQPARLAEGLYVAGDWRATPSIQGAIGSGRRAAQAYLAGR